MGVWGIEAWDSDGAADWFADAFRGIELDRKIEAALKYETDNYEQVRAAAYLLDVLGNPYIWPGSLDKRRNHIERALYLLREMINPDSTIEGMDFLELWNHEPQVIASVRQQIERLEERIVAIAART